MVVTLGDVLYSGLALDRMLAMTEFVAAGTVGEVFGLRFDISEFHKVEDALKKSIEQAEMGVHHGKLWSFVKNYNGLKQATSTGDIIGKHMLAIGDGFTRDFDEERRYKTYLQQLSEGLTEPTDGNS
jgi:hypothetical protein